MPLARLCLYGTSPKVMAAKFESDFQDDTKNLILYPSTITAMEFSRV